MMIFYWPPGVPATTPTAWRIVYADDNNNNITTNRPFRSSRRWCVQPLARRRIGGRRGAGRPPG